MRWADVGGAANFNGGDRFLRFPIGEAVVVDAGEHGKLFGLLNSPPLHEGEGGWCCGPHSSRPFSARSPGGVLIPLLSSAAREGAQDAVALRQTLADLPGVHELPREHWPVMVRFCQVDDPSSVELVHRNELSRTFSSSASVEHVTIEVVDAPITQRIETDLPWLSQHRGSRVRNVPGQGERSLPQRINHTHFRLTEEDWR
jgi:hypothetical protein